MPDLDVQQMARDLAAAASAIERHVAAEATKRATKLAVEYAKAAEQRIKDNAVDLQRAQDLAAERGRQLAYAVRGADKAARLAAEIRRARFAGRDTIDLETLEAILNAPAAPEHAEG